MIRMLAWTGISKQRNLLNGSLQRWIHSRFHPARRAVPLVLSFIIDKSVFEEFSSSSQAGRELLLLLEQPLKIKTSSEQLKLRSPAESFPTSSRPCIDKFFWFLSISTLVLFSKPGSFRMKTWNLNCSNYFSIALAFSGSVQQYRFDIAFTLVNPSRCSRNNGFAQTSRICKRFELL